mmetsp:Transcript_13519/g.47021  ORF Transcript_13519/g.47021 Transcript_13519/m.47021 type:complete len:202 (+) Transcript_13519:108-713(+)
MVYQLFERFKAGLPQLVASLRQPLCRVFGAGLCGSRHEGSNSLSQLQIKPVRLIFSRPLPVLLCLQLSVGIHFLRRVRVFESFYDQIPRDSETRVCTNFRRMLLPGRLAARCVSWLFELVEHPFDDSRRDAILNFSCRVTSERQVDVAGYPEGAGAGMMLAGDLAEVVSHAPQVEVVVHEDENLGVVAQPLLHPLKSKVSS